MSETRPYIFIEPDDSGKPKKPAIFRPRRIILKISDVMLIKNVKYSQAWRTLKQIKLFFNKPLKGVVTVGDYCIFYGMKVEEVMSFITPE